MGKSSSKSVCLALGLALLVGTGIGAQEPEKKQPPAEKKPAPPATKDKAPEPKGEPEKKGRLPAGKTLAELLSQLKDKDNENRGEAAEKLAKMGKGARPATPELLTLLQDKKDTYGRRLAAYVLGYNRPVPDLVAPVLLQALKDQDKDKDGVRRLAAKAIIQLGPKGARPATKELLERLKDKEDPDLRQLAAYIVGNIEPDPNEVRQPLLNAAKREKVEFVRKAMVEALKKIDADAAAQIDDM